MTTIELYNAYFGANIFLIATATIAAILRLVGRRLRIRLSYSHLVNIGYLLTYLLVCQFLVGLFAHKISPVVHVVDVWSAASLEDYAQGPGIPPIQPVVSLFDSAFLPLHIAGEILLWILLAGLAFWFARLFYDARITIRLLRSSHTVRSLGRVRLVVSETASSPCSFYFPGRRFIVIPVNLALNYSDLVFALKHEAEHHRQQHTTRIFWLRLVQAAFFWNPAIHWLVRQILQLQELACDEAATQRRRISPRRYAEFLARLAGGTMTGDTEPLTRLGIVTCNRAVLMSRIESLLTRPPYRIHFRHIPTVGLIAALFCMAIVLFSVGGIRDQRIDQRAASQMATSARNGTDFPIEINDRVVTQLNRLLATPDGLASTRSAVLNSRQYERVISEQLDSLALPPELLAVPFVESRYKNRPSNIDLERGSGLWKLIGSTARRYGLEVGRNRDERLDVPASTSAALQLFSELRGQLSEWPLAIFAYHVGEPEVTRRINESGNTDAWEIAQVSDPSGNDYLAEIIAAVLILNE